MGKRLTAAAESTFESLVTFCLAFGCPRSVADIVILAATCVPGTGWVLGCAEGTGWVLGLKSELFAGLAAGPELGVESLDAPAKALAGVVTRATQTPVTAPSDRPIMR